MEKKPSCPPSPKRMGFFMGGIAVFMLGISFASVPLYRLFCQQTGYGGTPKLVYQGTFSHAPSPHQLTIRFNADVHRHLPWSFRPLQTQLLVQAGAQVTAFYEVTNLTSAPMTGIASYNVTPDKAAPYFNKIDCFCFEEQRVLPGPPMTMPVQFFIDPAIVKDHPDVTTITLSYTFFEVNDFKP